MVGKFAHSFDRETFHGSSETRQDAFKTALEKIPELASPPDSVYVGKRVPLDVGANGLAEMILGAMRRRMREQTNDPSNPFLTRVNEHQLAELDDEIDRVVRAWLAKNDLTPSQSRIVAISEHPVPQPSGKTKQMQAANEVSDLGPSDDGSF